MPVNETFSRFVADFGEPVVIGTTTVTAIVDLEYYEAALGEAGQESTQPQITLPTATIPTGTAEGTAVTVRNVAYTIRNIKPDGTGMTTIDLTR
jgi:hypothetical protein